MKLCSACGCMITDKSLRLVGRYKPIEVCKECTLKLNRMLGHKLTGMDDEKEGEEKVTEEQVGIIKWLNRAFYADNKIKALEAVREKNRALEAKYSISYEHDSSESGKHDNSQERILHEIGDNDLAIKQELDALVGVRTEISQAIKQLNNDELETILNMRYLGYMNMQQIADKLHYDRKTIQRKHIVAIDKIKMSLNVAPDL